MDFDATQAIQLSDQDDDTDDEQGEKEKKPLAYLKVLAYKGQPACDYPIFEGENVIGRQEGTCSVYVPFKALSKEHACIEIKGDLHLINDKGSRNKTRKGKLFLKPEVRYELKDSDLLTFADVQCTYQMVADEDKFGNETGSETGSESMLILGSEPDAVDIDSGLTGEQSEPSSDLLLQPTQAYNLAERNNNLKRNVDDQLYAADTMAVADMPSEEGPKSDSVMYMPDSDEEDGPKEIGETLVYEEDECVNEEELRKMAFEPTQFCLLETDPDEVTDSEAFNAPTQVFSENVNDQSDDIDTQAYAMDVDETPSTDINNQKRKVHRSREIGPEAATQAYEMMASDDEVEETLEGDGDEDSTQTLEKPISSLGFGATLVDCEVETDDETDTVQSGALPFGGESKDEAEREIRTQSFGGNATLLIEDSPIFTRGRGRVVDISTTDVDCIPETQVLSQPTSPNASTVKTRNSDGGGSQDATQIIQPESDNDCPETQVLNDDETLCVAALNHPGRPSKKQFSGDTLSLDDTLALDSQTTKATDSDATQPLDSTLVICPRMLQKPSIKTSDDTSSVDTQILQSKASSLDETQVLEPELLICPFKKPTKSSHSDGTQVLEATQLLGPASPPNPATNKSSRKSSFGDVITCFHPALSSTQLICDDDTDGNLSLELNNSTDSEQPRSDEPKEENLPNTEQPTQNASDKRLVSEKPPTTSYLTDDICTQAYELEVPEIPEKCQSSNQGDNTDDLCTQAYQEHEKGVITDVTTRGESAKRGQQDKSETVGKNSVVIVGETPELNTDDICTQAYQEAKKISVPDVTTKGQRSKRGQYNKSAAVGKNGVVSVGDAQVINSDDICTQAYEREDKTKVKETTTRSQRSKRAQNNKCETVTVNSSEVPAYAVNEKNKETSQKRTRNQRFKTGRRSNLEDIVEEQTVTNTRSTSKGGSTQTTPESSKQTEAVSSRLTVTKAAREKSQEKNCETEEVKGKAVFTDDMDTQAYGNEAEETNGTGDNKLVTKGDAVTQSSTSAPDVRGDVRTRPQVGKGKGRGKGKQLKRKNEEVKSPDYTDELATQPFGTAELGVVSKRARSTRKNTDELNVKSTGQTDDIETQAYAMDSETSSDITRVESSQISEDEECDSHSVNLLPALTRSEKKKEAEVTTNILQRSTRKTAANTTSNTQPPARTRRGRNKDVSVIEINTTTSGDSAIVETSRDELEESRKVEDETISTRSGRVKGGRVAKKKDLTNSEIENPNTVRTKRSRAAPSAQNVIEETENVQPAVSISSGGRKTRGRAVLEVPEESSNATGLRGKRSAESTTAAETSVMIVEEENTSKRSRRGRPKKPEETIVAPVTSTRSTRGKTESSARSTRGETVTITRSTRSETETGTQSKRGKTESKVSNKSNRASLIVLDEETTPAKTSNKKDVKRESVIIVSPDKLSVSARGKKKDVLTVPDTETTRGRRGRQATAKKASESVIVLDDTIVSVSSDNNQVNQSCTSVQSKSTRGRKRPISTDSSLSQNSNASQSVRGKKRATTAPVAHDIQLNTSARRRSGVDRRPKVMFTGVIDENGKKIVVKLGGQLVDSIFDCTHLVTDKRVVNEWNELSSRVVDSDSYNGFKNNIDKLYKGRTVKFLCGVARGLLIVNLEWLFKSSMANYFIDATPYMVKDNESEAKFNFSLTRSVAKAAEHRLLDGYQVHVTKSVQPEPPQIKDIVKCAGGQILTTMPKKSIGKAVVISCKDDANNCRAAAAAGIPVVTTEFLLTGILVQEVNLETDYNLMQQILLKAGHRGIPDESE